VFPNLCRSQYASFSPLMPSSILRRRSPPSALLFFSPIKRIIALHFRQFPVSTLVLRPACVLLSPFFRANLRFAGWLGVYASLAYVKTFVPPRSSGCMTTSLYSYSLPACRLAHGFFLKSFFPPFSGSSSLHQSPPESPFPAPPLPSTSLRCPDSCPVSVTQAGLFLSTRSRDYGPLRAPESR